MSEPATSVYKSRRDRRTWSIWCSLTQASCGLASDLSAWPLLVLMEWLLLLVTTTLATLVGVLEGVLLLLLLLLLFNCADPTPAGTDDDGIVGCVIGGPRGV